jgi:uncharacterized caspase-like protein
MTARRPIQTTIHDCQIRGGKYVAYERATYASALAIGNQYYETLPDLDTAINGAEAVARMLDTKFGYKVTLLRNADRYETLSTLNRLRKELADKDILLVYYAGHGELDRVNLRGHWLPVDAEAQNTANWISDVSITDILNAMAVGHVLLIADSCYSGALTRSSLSQVESGQSEEARSHWLKTLSKMRSRTALTLGGLTPVLDGGGGGHSVFAKSLLSVLRELNDITGAQRVYREMSTCVAPRCAAHSWKTPVSTMPGWRGPTLQRRR